MVACNRASTTVAVSLLLCQTSAVKGFVIPELLSLSHGIISVAHTLPAPPTLDPFAISSSSVSFATDASQQQQPLEILFRHYLQVLDTHPLVTKMATGGVIAVAGDAIAQATTTGSSAHRLYDAQRAAAFCAFDMAYRAVQHYLYPPMIELCDGQNIYSSLIGTTVTTTAPPPLWAAALEQALVSQLIIVPIIYYPTFFAVTGAVQGLTMTQTMQRAKTTFVPLMKRNLLFWIPVQCAVFGLVTSQDVQIPVLTFCGLVWTIILSILAGSVGQSNGAVGQSSTSTSSTSSNQETNELPKDLEVVIMANGTAAMLVDDYDADIYCLTGMEAKCEIDPDNLFRAPHHYHYQVVELDNEEAVAVPPQPGNATTVNELTDRRVKASRRKSSF